MNKLTYLLVLLALSVPFLEGYEYHPSSQEDSSPSDSDGNTFYGRFLRGAHRRLWGPSSGGCSKIAKFFTSCSNRDQYTTGNQSGGGNHPNRPDTIRPGNIIDVLKGDRSQYSILLALLESAGLTESLEGDGPFTLFAPRNSAFIGMDAAALQSDPIALQQILTYHVVGEEVGALEMQTGQELQTLQGGNITLTVDVSIPSVKLNGDAANAVMVDMKASNGVIHTIDAVLTPTSASTSSSGTPAPAAATPAPGSAPGPGTTTAPSAAAATTTAPTTPVR